MKSKLIPIQSCLEKFRSKKWRSAPKSPIEELSGPDTTVLYEWMGKVIPTTVPNVLLGAIFRWRLDEQDAPAIYNRDGWELFSTQHPDWIRLKEMRKASVPNHHSEKLL